MKSIRSLTTLTVALSATVLVAQPNTWSQRSDIGLPFANGSYPLVYAASFSIGGKGYVVTGSYTTGQARTWEYDPNGDQWVEKAVFPGAARTLASGFSIGTKGYVCLGGYDDLWEYDAGANLWAQKADFPGQARASACVFVINGVAYISNGSAGAIHYSETWRYDPATDSWSPRSACPGTARSSAVSFTNGSIGYISTGSTGGSSTLSDTWAYDPSTDLWTQKANIPQVLRQGVAFTIGNRSFAGTGQYGVPTTVTGGWYEYDPATNTWATRAWAMSRWSAFAFVINGKGYLGGGNNFAYNSPDGGPLASFQEYDPTANTWVERARMSASPTMAAASFAIGGQGFVLSGGTTGYFCAPESWSYDPITDAWSRISFTAKYGLTTGFAIGNTGYQGTGINNTYTHSTMRAYAPATDQWSYKAAFGGGTRSRAVSFTIGAKGYLGMGNQPGVGRTRDIWSYDPATNTWSQVADFGGTARWNPTAFTIGDKAYAGLGQDQNGICSDMWRYDPAANTWTQIADFPGGPRESATAFSIGNKAFVFGGTNSLTAYNDLWAYDAITDQWQAMAPMPADGRYAAPTFVIGGTAYVTSGSSSSANDLLKDTWAYNSGMEPLALQIKVFLEGPYAQGPQLMRDDLRTLGLIPVPQPHTQAGMLLTQGVDATIAAGVLTVAGANAIVDHVIIEVRHPSTPTVRLAAIPALVQRDGDVVAMDGVSPVTMIASAGSYHVAVRHRNHLGVMTATPVALSAAPTTVDFTNTATLTYGTGAQKQVGSKMLMWSGDVTGNGTIAYTGAGNDRDPILTAIGGTLPTATLTGQYRVEDVNLDGVVKYVGLNNDRDPILVNVGGTTPTNTRTQQLP
ncbi:MAG: kelch repeat-containing protein [Flavobacteriales bacterium]